jgi:outer membrane immunogenic protein
MKKILLACLGMAALTGQGMAADMPVKAPVAAPVVTWNGCYVGSYIGGGWGRANRRDVDPNSSGFGLDLSHINLSGYMSGGQVGCNYQIAPNWVIGVEGDAAWAHKHGEGADLAPFNTSFMADITERWVATARGRIGYATDKWFLYVTGGGAWADVRLKVFNLPVNNGAGFTPFGYTSSATFSGWTVGAGLEWWLIPSSLSAKAEYLFMDLGSHTFVAPSCCVTNSTKIETQHIARVGLNYHFNWASPVVARY